ncbi:hypothetical protein HDV06_000800 [Boothiomyces sp. JEL0866]|nr:hypothetical protein HDV06_000800 [Boothiomyces sp. JEL0866]
MVIKGRQSIKLRTPASSTSRMIAMMCLPHETPVSCCARLIDKSTSVSVNVGKDKPSNTRTLEANNTRPQNLVSSDPNSPWQKGIYNSPSLNLSYRLLRTVLQNGGSSINALAIQPIQEEVQSVEPNTVVIQRYNLYHSVPQFNASTEPLYYCCFKRLKLKQLYARYWKQNNKLKKIIATARETMRSVKALITFSLLLTRFCNATVTCNDAATRRQEILDSATCEKILDGEMVPNIREDLRKDLIKKSYRWCDDSESNLQCCQRLVNSNSALTFGGVMLSGVWSRDDNPMAYLHVSCKRETSSRLRSRTQAVVTNDETATKNLDESVLKNAAKINIWDDS